MKKIILILLLFLSTYNSWAGIVGPDDLPTISALIELHKQMAKAEELSVHQVSASYLEQGVATENTTKFHEVRKTLNSKLNNAHQWIILAAAMSKTTLDVGNATKEYIQFTKLMSNNLFRKPQIAWYFAETNYNVNFLLFSSNLILSHIIVHVAEEETMSEKNPFSSIACFCFRAVPSAIYIAFPKVHLI